MVANAQTISFVVFIFCLGFSCGWLVLKGTR